MLPSMLVHVIDKQKNETRVLSVKEMNFLLLMNFGIIKSAMETPPDHFRLFKAHLYQIRFFQVLLFPSQVFINSPTEPQTVLSELLANQHMRIL